MPAWTPDNESFAPYDEDGELRTDIPQDLAAFLQKFEISKSFTIELKKWNNEGFQGRPTIAATFEAVIPSYEGIVSLHGPGHYGIDVTWTPKGGKIRNEIYKISLVGERWAAMYKEAKALRHKAELEETKKTAQLEQAGLIPGAGTFQNPNDMGRQYMQGVVGDIKDLFSGLGLNLGKGLGGGGGQDQMGMMFLGMMQMMMKQSENTTQMLIAVMQNNNKSSDTKEMFGMLREAFALKEGLMPKDKSWIEEVVTALSDNIGPLVGLFARGNPPDDPLAQKLNSGLNETGEKARKDPAFLRGLVKHMDSKLGAKMTDQVLEGYLNVDRKGRTPGGASAPSSQDAAEG